jgi:histidyl-tRNA synthetase
MFGKEQIPACGFSLGLERILFVMDERGMFPPGMSAAGADILVTLWSDDTAAQTVETAVQIRRSGLRALVYPEPEKFGKQFKYAESLGIRFVAVVSDKPATRGRVKIKDLVSGEEHELDLDGLKEALDSILKKPQ